MNVEKAVITIGWAILARSQGRVSAAPSRGATILETAITLPIVLFLIFGVVWLGVAYNAKYSLKSAVQVATRMAVTRGAASTGGTQLIASLNSYNGGMPPLGLLATSTEQGGASSLYNAGVNSEFGAGAFCGFGNNSVCGTGPSYPRHYLYALAYTYAALAESIGGTLKYPCQQPGCVECYNYASPTQVGQWNQSTFDLRAVGVKCTYYPDNTLLAPVRGLLMLISGGTFGNVAITQEAAYPN